MQLKLKALSHFISLQVELIRKITCAFKSYPESKPNTLSKKFIRRVLYVLNTLKYTRLSEQFFESIKIVIRVLM